MNILSSILYFLLSRSRKITVSTTAPTSEDGANGDVWIVYEASSEE